MKRLKLNIKINECSHLNVLSFDDRKMYLFDSMIKGSVLQPQGNVINIFSLNSVGLGKFMDASYTIGLTIKKKLNNYRFHLFLILFLITIFQSTYNCSCLGIILGLQCKEDVLKYQETLHTRQTCSNKQGYVLYHCLKFSLVIGFICYLLNILLNWCIKPKPADRLLPTILEAIAGPGSVGSGPESA